ncbi:MAG: glycerol-3-phosphate acyltransferase [Actinomycetota bacterium]|nr:MAG: glycerol-3-phosphate acyltransferase [Actinomycetota bacterium]
MVDTIYFKILYVIAGYLLGSVLFSYIMVKIYSMKGEKKDLARVDRPGTAGVGRQYGIKAGLPTFLFDCGKGAAIVLAGKAIGLDDIIIAIACVAVIAGHNWPIWYRFVGGGGLATGMGIAGALMLIPFLIFLGISVAAGFIYKYTLGKRHKVNPNVFGGALGAFLFPVFIYLFGFVFERQYFSGFIYDQPLAYLIMAIVIFLIIVTKGIILHFIYRKVPTANKF